MIVGLCGLAGSGKDTVASILRRDFCVQPIAFADPIKRFCAKVFDWDEDRLWGPSENRSEPDPRYRREHRRLQAGSPDEYETFLDEGLTAREALQLLGTEWGRACYRDIWLEHGLSIARQLEDDPFKGYHRKLGIFDTKHFAGPRLRRGVAITDCRFPNEVLGIQRIGGIVVRVDRPAAGLSGPAAEHASEREMAHLADGVFDDVVVNDGSLLDLEDDVRRVFAGRMT